VIYLNSIMPKDNIQVDTRELYEAMFKAIKLKGYGRQARKQKHIAKRKGKIDHRTGRPGKAK
tara:strand:- start:1190 stop:1375 length:186 start_codon:yes stop_codon:yes gene_type:complete